ncbi:MAG: DUF1289 domain-containing protein [Janthinobacterium lividum]
MNAKNPCIDICKFDENVCIGCGRTKAECKGWKKMEKDERREVNELSIARVNDMKATGQRKKKKH